MGFEVWSGVNSSPDQIKRQESARGAACTPLSVDRDDMTGTFSGSHGTYIAALESCSCVDFLRRNLPCKHMYRLAHELGAFDLGVVSSDASKVKAPAPTSKQRKAALGDIVEKIEQLTIPEQKALIDLLRMAYKDEPLFCEDPEIFSSFIAEGLIAAEQDPERVLQMKRRDVTLDGLAALDYHFPEGLKNTKKARMEHCMEHAAEICALVYPKAVFLRPAGDLLLAKRKVYTYLLRKLDQEPIYVGGKEEWRSIPHGAEETAAIGADGSVTYSIAFPDDEITKLLDKYGVNPCRGWKP